MTSDNEISAETSKGICEDMNDDHAVTVYAMAMAKFLGAFGQWKLTDARLVQVSLSGCKISAVTWQGDVCETKPLFYKFEPPLASPSQARSELIAIHQKVCALRLQTLASKPQALKNVCIVAAMGYGTWMGVPEMTEALGNAKPLIFFLGKTFGSASVLAELVRFFFYFCIVAHAAEAIWAVYKCQSVLKLKFQACFMWFLAVSTIGYPILNELNALLAIDQAAKQAAAAKKSN
jgi:hypothetical protein